MSNFVHNDQFCPKCPLLPLVSNFSEFSRNFIGSFILVLSSLNLTILILQESYVQLTMLEEHVRNEAVFKAMERSIHSARHVFNEYFYQTHQTKFVEYALLDSWYQFLNNEDLTGFNLDADMIFYLQTDPEIAYQRAVSRGRPEEATLQKEFLYGIHRLHEDWLIHGNTTTQAKVPSPV